MTYSAQQLDSLIDFLVDELLRDLENENAPQSGQGICGALETTHEEYQTPAP